MVDTTGSFDPRNLLKKPTGVGTDSSSIPNVSPYQPVGNGIQPVVPFGSNSSNLPMGMNQSTPQTPISMNRSEPQITPTAPTAPLPTSQISEPQIHPPAPVDTGPSDPRFQYGYLPNQWEINRNIEATHDKNMAGGGYVQGWGREQALNEIPGYLGTKRHPNNPAGFVPGLPDETAYKAYQAKQLEPYNASVAARGASVFNAPAVPTTPNYVAPTTVPTGPQIAPTVNDIWSGTQTRKPSYF